MSALRGYFRRHEYANTTLQDLLDALADASGRDLSTWSKEWLQTAGVKPGARVSMTIELDDEPLPTDVVPDELAAALKKNRSAATAWTALAPSHRREHVKALLSAKLPDTRSRRVARILAALTKSP